MTTLLSISRGLIAGAFMAAAACTAQPPAEGRVTADAPSRAAALREVTAPTLIEALSDPGYARRVHARLELVRRGSSAAEPLRAAMADKTMSATGRIHALWAVVAIAQQHADVDPSPLLLASLHNGPPELRAQAARAIGLRKMADDRSIKGLIHRARNDADPVVRRHAAAALGRIGAREAATELFACLDDADDQARDAKVLALRRINSWEAAIAFLNAADERVRQGAVQALAGVDDAKAIEALKWAATQSPYEEVRAAAMKVLEQPRQR